MVLNENPNENKEKILNGALVSFSAPGPALFPPVSPSTSCSGPTSPLHVCSFAFYSSLVFFLPVFLFASCSCLILPLLFFLFKSCSGPAFFSFPFRSFSFISLTLTRHAIFLIVSRNSFVCQQSSL